MQSVDIDQLLSQEQYVLSRGAHEMPVSTDTLCVSEIFNPFAHFFIKNRTNLAVTDVMIDTAEGVFLLNVSADRLTLRQSRGAKRREFVLDFERQFLTVDQRKATRRDFETCRDQVTKIHEVMAVDFPELLIAFSDEFPDSDTVGAYARKLIEKIVSFFGFDQILSYFHVRKIPELIRRRVSSSVGKMAEVLTAVVAPVSEKGAAENRCGYLIEAVRNTVREVVTQIPNAIITNTGTTSRKPTLAYTMAVTETYVRYVESGAQIKNRIECDLLAGVFTLNGQEMNYAAMQWWIEKIKKVGADLMAQRAQLFEQMD